MINWTLLELKPSNFCKTQVRERKGKPWSRIKYLQISTLIKNVCRDDTKNSQNSSIIQPHNKGIKTVTCYNLDEF